VSSDSVGSLSSGSRYLWGGSRARYAKRAGWRAADLLGDDGRTLPSFVSTWPRPPALMASKRAQREEQISAGISRRRWTENATQRPKKGLSSFESSCGFE
jgi:hypothetical protein